MGPFSNKKNSVVISATALSLIIIALVVFFTIFGSISGSEGPGTDVVETFIRSL